jgi:hypothetical protein
MPGCKKYKTGFIPKELKLNPFEIVWLDKSQEPNILTHIDRLKSVFAAAFPMYDIPACPDGGFDLYCISE